MNLQAVLYCIFDIKYNYLIIRFYCIRFQFSILRKNEIVCYLNLKSVQLNRKIETE